MVYCSSINEPMDYDCFLLWLKKVDGFLLAKDWVGIEGHWDKWIVTQFGLNIDAIRMRSDSCVKAVTLQGFKSWFARVYDKKQLGVNRFEIHCRDERSLEDFLALVSGGISHAQTMGTLGLVASSLNNQGVSNQVDLNRLNC
jgi:hypothetical protein